MSFLEPPDSSMVWPTSPGAMACSWRVSCSLDAPAAWRRQSPSRWVLGNDRRADERRLMATSFWICASCEEGLHGLEVLGDSRLALAAGGQNLLIYLRPNLNQARRNPESQVAFVQPRFPPRSALESFFGSGATWTRRNAGGAEPRSFARSRPEIGAFAVARARLVWWRRHGWAPASRQLGALGCRGLGLGSSL